jgi:geranylgeranyl diphosphate synthase type II
MYFYAKIYKMNLDLYKELFLNHLSKKIEIKDPKNLYIPIQYILNLGGKRLRPILTLMACDLFNSDSKKALDAALAIEVFHNFTLIHDDIMDNAPIRRGKITVHEKWDNNTAILSGDAMMILASQLFEAYEPKLFKSLVQLFNKTALEVCEGQQYDVDFETRNDVSIPEYVKMITFKTSVLVASAMKMGALIANANENECEAIYNYGLHLGIAFQLQDDYLDTYGNAATFGKQIGGDIIENKKTFLYLKALEKSDEVDKLRLIELYNNTDINSDEKIREVKSLFNKYLIAENVKEQIESYTNSAFDYLDELSVSDNKKQILKEFGLSLMKRTI